MEATLIAPRPRAEQSVSALGKISIAIMIVIALELIYLQAALIGMMIPPLVVFVVLSLIFAGVIARGFRWAPMLAVVISVAMLALNAQPILSAVTNPSVSFPMFMIGATMLPATIAGIIGGIAATVQNYRYAPELRKAPRGLAYGITAMVAVIVGALLVAGLPTQGITAGISPETLDALPVVSTKHFEFEQKEIRAKVGETVALKLTNADGEAHYLDIDEFDVHAPIPAGKTGLAIFKATQPGTYTFYCRTHANKATGEGMIGKLIIE